MAGVRTGSGDVIRADVVVDAMGRRSPLADMLSAIGARRPIEEREQLGFVYYARHFRSISDDIKPIPFGLVPVDGMSLLVIPADGRTFSVLFSCASNDHEVRALRDEQTWEQVLALFPDLTEVRSASEPITREPRSTNRECGQVRRTRPDATSLPQHHTDTSPSPRGDHHAAHRP